MAAGAYASADEHDFSEQFSIAQRESVGAFGDNTMYLERVLSRATCGVQIIADTYGTVILRPGRPDCSVQRNHQKMIEKPRP